MAQAGFPWHAQAKALDEKANGGAFSKSGVTFDNTANKAQKLNGTAVAGSRQNRSMSEPSRAKSPVKRIPVRTIPAWIQDAEEDELIEAGYMVPDAPQNALIATHNHTPATSQRPLLSSQLQNPMPNGYLTSSGMMRSEPTSRWMSFARASAYPRERFDSEKVDEEWLNQNFTDYSKPWLADHAPDADGDGSDQLYRAFRRKRRAWYKRFHYALMRNPFIPLVFRLIVICFAAVAMALGASIHHENNIVFRCLAQDPGDRTGHCAQLLGEATVEYNHDASSLLAIIVDAIAIVYTLYITYDEYFSKPLGLRSPGAKARLVLLDLIFIVFQAANLSLSFNALAIDQGPCQGFLFVKVCNRAEALSSVLLVSLVAWILTFSLSILRLVNRMETR